MYVYVLLTLKLCVCRTEKRRPWAEIQSTPTTQLGLIRRVLKLYPMAKALSHLNNHPVSLTSKLFRELDMLKERYKCCCVLVGHVQQSWSGTCDGYSQLNRTKNSCNQDNGMLEKRFPCIFWHIFQFPFYSIMLVL